MGPYTVRWKYLCRCQEPEFESKIDPLTNKVSKYTAFKKAAPQPVINAISPLYQKLIETEAQSGIEGSAKYLVGYLEDQGKNYDLFIDDLIGDKGLFAFFFKAIKKMFGWSWKGLYLKKIEIRS